VSAPFAYARAASSGTIATLTLVSVNVGKPHAIGQIHDEPVISGIAKTSIGDVPLAVTTTNLDGDGQADLRAHGGPDKAVYAYPSEHLPAWSAELGEDLGPGAFGENLTTAGLVEREVIIGDMWTWGTVVLQVCQPRYPCYKLGIHRGRPDMVARFLDSARSGWYLRVLQPGTASRTDPITVIDRVAGSVSVHTASRAILAGHATVAELESIIALPPLAESWRRGLERRLEIARSDEA
jgi:MOSC domain-containing protein YiiM